MRLALRVKDSFTRHRLPPQTRAGAMAGFTIIEILLVIALMGVIMIVVVPNFNIASSSQESAKVNGIAGDIRAAYDMAVLNRRPYRLAFEFKTGDYWLESTQRTDFQLGD
ncbi:MAG: type II secretion system protein, partial [Proteobacteria bacterium]